MSMTRWMESTEVFRHLAAKPSDALLEPDGPLSGVDPGVSMSWMMYLRTAA